MKRICTRCSRTSSDGNLWCQEKFCPAEENPEIFERGEWLGNIQIAELVTVLRSSAIYVAQRNKEKILIKVAHSACQEKLKREARLLVEISKRRKHPMLPVLLPAHEQASLIEHPYGKTVINGQTKYYLVFQFAEGELLKDILTRTPQPWYQDVGWIAISIADAVAQLHQYQRLHLCISPEMILVRYDKQGIPRPLLLDLGVASDAGELLKNFDRRFVLPAYTAPELIEMKGKVGPASDVYGLGLILYEMLTGRPAFDPHQRDEVVYDQVLTTFAPATGRNDLRNIPQIAERAISRDYSARQRDLISFAREIQANIPVVPREKKPFRINWSAVAIVVGSALAISLLLVLAAIQL